VRLLLLIALLAVLAAPALAGTGPPSAADRVEELQQDLDSLVEDVEDLREPVEEFELFDECMYLIGVSEFGDPRGAFGYRYRSGIRPALALHLGDSGRPRYRFLAFPGEEPPSIECNEDAEEEFIDN
jgi:hypothetical protein